MQLTSRNAELSAHHTQRVDIERLHAEHEESMAVANARIVALKAEIETAHRRSDGANCVLWLCNERSKRCLCRGLRHHLYITFTTFNPPALTPPG